MTWLVGWALRNMLSNISMPTESLPSLPPLVEPLQKPFFFLSASSSLESTCVLMATGLPNPSTLFWWLGRPLSLPVMWQNSLAMPNSTPVLLITSSFALLCCPSWPTMNIPTPLHCFGQTLLKPPWMTWRMPLSPTLACSGLIIENWWYFALTFQCWVLVTCSSSQTTTKHQLKHCRTTGMVKDSPSWPRICRLSSILFALGLWNAVAMKFGYTLISKSVSQVTMVLIRTDITCSANAASGSWTIMLWSSFCLTRAATLPYFGCRCTWCVGTWTSSISRTHS